MKASSPDRRKTPAIKIPDGGAHNRGQSRFRAEVTRALWTVEERFRKAPARSAAVPKCVDKLLRAVQSSIRACKTPGHRPTVFRLLDLSRFVHALRGIFCDREEERGVFSLIERRASTRERRPRETPHLRGTQRPTTGESSARYRGHEGGEYLCLPMRICTRGSVNIAHLLGFEEP